MSSSVCVAQLSRSAVDVKPQIRLKSSFRRGIASARRHRIAGSRAVRARLADKPTDKVVATSKFTKDWKLQV